MKTTVEWLFNQLSINNIALDKGTRAHQEMEQKILEKAKEMEREDKIEFACQVAEASAMKYIQGKTTMQIAEEVIKQQEQ
jgi:hypothetical protein